MSEFDKVWEEVRELNKTLQKPVKCAMLKKQLLRAITDGRRESYVEFELENTAVLPLQFILAKFNCHLEMTGENVDISKSIVNTYRLVPDWISK